MISIQKVGLSHPTWGFITHPQLQITRIMFTLKLVPS
jgi:hypothetical protein